MARSLLIRGLLVGLLAGLLMFAFGRVVGEPSVDRAIAYESTRTPSHGGAAHDHAHTAALEPEPGPVSRDRQAGLGLLTGVVVYGTAFGGLFALVFAASFGRIGAARPRAVAALLATAGFVSVSVVPMISYPTSPPAVGEPDTIAYRSALYFIMIAISVGAAIGGIVLRTRLVRRTDAWAASLSAVGAYVAVIIVAGVLLPAIDEVPADFPASVLWHFRLASMGMQLVMWSTFGVVFGVAAERLLAPRRLGRHLQTLAR